MKLVILDNVEAFIHDFDLKTYTRIRRNLDILEKSGHNLRMPYSKNILPNIFELRIIGQDNIRVIYTFSNDLIVVFYAFLKKTNQISLKDMRTIRSKYYNLYL